jgi:hypothetical protein
MQEYNKKWLKRVVISMLMIEVFYTIYGFDKYEISNLARIRNKKTKRFLKPKKDKDGYLHLGLYTKNGDRLFRRVHRLVAETFIINPFGKPYVDHFDGKVSNNNLENLRWATPPENGQHMRKYKESATNVKGVYLENDRYRVRLMSDGKYLSLGSFDTLEEAKKVRKDAVIEIAGEFCHPHEGCIITNYD